MNACRNIPLAVFALVALPGCWSGAAAWEESDLTHLVQSGTFRVQVARQHIDSLKTALLNRFFAGPTNSTGSAWGRWATYASRLQVGGSTDGTRVALPVPFRFGATERWRLLIEPLAGAQFHRTQHGNTNGFGRLKIAFRSRLLNEGPVRPSLLLAARTHMATAKNDPFGPGRGDVWGRLVAAKTFARFRVQASSTYRQQGLLVRSRYNIRRAELGGALSGAFQADKRYQLFGQIAGTTRLVRLDNTRRRPGLVGTFGVTFAPHPQVLCSAILRYRSDHQYSLQPGATIRF